MFRVLKHWFSSSAQPSRRQRRDNSVRPGLEVLEDRQLLSALIIATRPLAEPTPDIITPHVWQPSVVKNNSTGGGLALYGGSNQASGGLGMQIGTSYSHQKLTGTSSATPISDLTVTIMTGDDDVRHNSHVIFQLDLNNGVTSPSWDLNNGQEWANGTTHTIHIATLPDNITLSDINDFRVHFVSGQNSIFDTPDNWNMQSITVSYTGSDGQQHYVLQEAGGPTEGSSLHRFYGGNERDYVAPPTIPH